MRYERVQQELLRLRAAAGQEAHLPDFDAEEALREALAATEARKAQVGGWVGLGASLLAGRQPSTCMAHPVAAARCCMA